MVFLTLAALGTGAKGLFDFNRTGYKFDKSQHLEQECLRIELQLKRFALFREDIRDLVKLTVDRMDVYHLVGALFLQFCIVILTKGRVQASAPPFLLSLFLLTNACAFVYLLLAVWMSMHASIASHSFGVRLLTRFVRLPIPSMQELSDLTFKLRDFEKQGVAQLLRVPFTGRRGQMQREGEPAADTRMSLGPASVHLPSLPYISTAGSARPGPLASCKGGESAQAEPELHKQGSRATSGTRAQKRRAAIARGVGSEQSAGAPRPMDSACGEALLPEEAEAPIGGEDLLSGSSGALPERHVQLFRQLQSKWQCYDAYCRVCMGLGVNQMLQVLSYYAICHTIVENNSPTTGFAMTALFQCTTVAVGVLDLAGLKGQEIVAIQLVGTLPCFLTAGALSRGTREEGILDPDESYPLSPLSFFFTACWLELWLRVAAPSSGSIGELPRRFRQVLFLDVFGDSMGLDPAAEQDVDGSELQLDMVTENASNLRFLAQRAVRRWLAVPTWALSNSQSWELQRLKERLDRWGSTLQAELERRICTRDPAEALPLAIEREFKRWDSLPSSQCLKDPFAGCLLGPFSHDGVEALYHYDLDTQQTLFDDDASRARPGAPVLRLQAVASVLEDLEDEVRRLLELRITRDLCAETRRQRESRKARRLNGSSRSAAASFPNLLSLVQGSRGGRALATVAGCTRRGSASTSTDQAAGQDRAGAQPDRKGQQESADQTLVAVAGEHARHFVPEQLPWLLVRGMTRVLQLCWLWACFMAILREVDIYTIDFGVQIIQQKSTSESRRLRTFPALASEPAAVMWPHETFFRPQGLFCPPAGHSGQDRRIFISSPFALYSADAATKPLHLLEVRRRRLSPSTVVLCGPWLRTLPARLQLKSACAAISVTSDGLLSWVGDSIRPAGLAATLTSLNATRRASQKVHNRAEPPGRTLAWRLATGVIVRCSNVVRLLIEKPTAEWCFLMAAWDGQTLPVVAVRLPDDARQWLAAAERLTPSVNVPVTPSAQQRIVGLHIEPGGGQLLALFADGQLEAWNLFTLTRLGRWKLKRPVGTAVDVKPVLFCQDDMQQLLVLYRSSLNHLMLMQTSALPLDSEASYA